MKYRSIRKLATYFTLAICSATFTVEAQDAAALFKQNCGVCHTVGKGKLVGPDLKDVHTKRKEEWIIKFVKGSQALVNSGDADAKAVFEENGKVVMPDQNLTDDQIKTLIAYIGEQSGGAAAPVAASTEAAAPAAPAAAPTAELIAEGKALFEGSKAFKNGGASCISCHNVNYNGMIAGGVLAKDLTNSYTRLTAAGIGAFITSPPSAMAAAFKNNPVTPEESAALVAFLQDADKPGTPEGTNPLLIGGVVGFGVLFVLILLVWNNRKTKSTRKEIIERQIKAIN
jgi:mono/diheme cytochrome c family protein